MRLIERTSVYSLNAHASASIRPVAGPGGARLAAHHRKPLPVDDLSLIHI